MFIINIYFIFSASRWSVLVNSNEDYQNSVHRLFQFFRDVMFTNCVGDFNVGISFLSVRLLLAGQVNLIKII